MTTINVLIPNGVNNTKIYKQPTSPLRGFEIPRNDILNIKNYEYLHEFYGIYFLFSDDKVYIGKSNNVVDRLNTHNNDKNKDFFTSAVIFTTENNILTETFIDYLEYKFINKINKNSSYELVNIDLRNRKPNVTDFDLPVIDELYNDIILYLGVMKYDLFVDNVEEKKIFTINASNRRAISGTKIDARGLYSGGQFEILAGSIGYKRTIDKFMSKYEELLESGKIIEVDDTYFKVVRNIKLSPSFAASIILNNKSENGWWAWKLSTDKDKNLGTEYKGIQYLKTASQ